MDGVDLTEGTTGLQLTITEDGPSVLHLWRRADAVVVEGAAVVQVGELADAAAAVREMDVEAMKAEALARGDRGGTLIHQVVEMIAERLEAG